VTPALSGRSSTPSGAVDGHDLSGSRSRHKSRDASVGAFPLGALLYLMNTCLPFRRQLHQPARTTSSSIPPPPPRRVHPERIVPVDELWGVCPALSGPGHRFDDSPAPFGGDGGEAATAGAGAVSDPFALPALPSLASLVEPAVAAECRACRSAPANVRCLPCGHASMCSVYVGVPSFRAARAHPTHHSAPHVPLPPPPARVAPMFPTSAILVELYTIVSVCPSPNTGLFAGATPLLASATAPSASTLSWTQCPWRRRGTRHDVRSARSTVLQLTRTAGVRAPCVVWSALVMCRPSHPHTPPQFLLHPLPFPTPSRWCCTVPFLCFTASVGCFLGGYHDFEWSPSNGL
jgi:hypothetical protein